VCEDNQWSATTRTGALSAGDGAAARARAHGVPARAVDGNDVEAVYAATRELVAEVRAGAGPRLLHARTYRFKGHVSVDPAAYRDPAELQAALADDPLRRAHDRLLARGAAAALLAATEHEARAEITRALASAAAAPWPEAAAAFEQVQDAGAGTWR
jgi:pyruvate dehydrogenase E1 component alpha subunit